MLQVIDDRSRRLTPFWNDQDQVCAWLTTLFPPGGLERARSFDGSTPRMWQAGSGFSQPYRAPPPGTLVLVLGDLGSLAHDPRCVRNWVEFGRRVRSAGGLPVALLPCPPSRWPASLRRVWRLVEWERQSALESGRRNVTTEQGVAEEGAADRLLRLLSPAIRVEPGLLRDVRRALLPSADAAAEADFWQNAALASDSSVAATLAPDVAASLRQDFDAEEPEIRHALLELVRRWRAGLSADVWFEEVISLGADSRSLLPPSEVTEAATRFDQLSRWAPTIHDPLARAEMAHALRGLLHRLPRTIGTDTRVGAAMERLWRMTESDAGAGESPRLIHLRQSGGDLVAVAEGDDARSGSPLARVWTADGLIVVTEGDARNGFWKTGAPPFWARDWGWDEIGAWVTFAINDVTQRLRWIPPGRFLMGSPDDEQERDDDEGPQHLVMLSRGYWLFDTACTQALWRAVMGENPSRFTGDDRRPVERVSWNDVQGFLKRLNGWVPGLDLCLPTEAQWEHACRAGTTTPFSFGATITPEQANYNGNSPYADGPKGLYRKSTASVGSLPPNAWGLYEMHGNVWEWCADGQRDYTAEEATDPRGPESAGADRVLRGGSWNSHARFARAACRYGYHPDDRNYLIGFRCARVQEGNQASPKDAAEPTAPALPRLAERRGTQGAAGGVVLRVASGTGGGARCPWPQALVVRIHTDREELRVERITLPSWAAALGRDRFGLWAEIVVEPEDGGESVTQRLRWIPPGRFLMGSREDEPERYDDEGPQHLVTLSRGYWLFDTACTQALWRAVMGKNPSHFKGNDRHPVDNVSWHDVQGFLRRLNARVPGLDLCLPTEAQWEHACRAGTTTPFSFGSAITHEQVNCNGNHPYADGPKGPFRQSTVPVGSLPPNPWGLYEMHGNLWEWCADGQRNYTAEPATDPRGPESVVAERVRRGGSWDGGARNARAARRSGGHPDAHYSGIGFRCARVKA
ncbi:formylglycine-generating enzyme family protein [Azospirillum sp. TSO5]|uniref:formylglycine-generating enzyme family protein n=1 Tax=Azospirillum sp. TSO5 TaxID=716760 RepID=UPI0018EE51A3|nr:formylglycine-generating enzyme family protein [Azospirillum sp. TSO5]